MRFDREQVELRKGPVSKTQRVRILRIMRRALSRGQLIVSVASEGLNVADPEGSHRADKTSLY